MVKHNKADNGETKSKKWLLAILSLLILVIIGLIAGIVVLNMDGGGAGDGLPEVIKSDDEIINDLMNEIKPLSTEESESYLDEKLREFAGTSIESRIRIMKVYVFLNAGFFDDAIAVAQDINEGELSDKERLDYYEALWQSYRGIGDEDKFNEYSAMWVNLYNKIYDGGGGGD